MFLDDDDVSSFLPDGSQGLTTHFDLKVSQFSPFNHFQCGSEAEVEIEHHQSICLSLYKLP